MGKSSLTIRFINNDFNEKQESTVDATHNKKEVEVAPKTTVNLMIWDTAGQERYHALNVSYYRDAKGALIVYDVTDEGSFLKVKTWVMELKKYLPGAPILICANKCDMPNRAVDEGMALAYAKEVGAEHILTSAKSGMNVKDAFTKLAKSKRLDCLFYLYSYSLGRVGQAQGGDETSCQARERGGARRGHAGF